MSQNDSKNSNQDNPKRSSSFSSQKNLYVTPNNSIPSSNSRARSNSVSDRINLFNEISKQDSITPKSQITSDSQKISKVDKVPISKKKESNDKQMEEEMMNKLNNKPALPTAPKPKVIPPRPKGILPTETKERTEKIFEINPIETESVNSMYEEEVIDGYTLKVHVKTNTLDIIKKIIAPVDMSVLNLKQLIASKCNLETEAVYITNSYVTSSLSNGNNSVFFPQLNVNSDIQKEILLSRYILSIPNFYSDLNNSALFLDDQEKPLSYYGLKREENIEFRLQANPMSDRMAKVTVINIEGEKDILQVDVSNPASYLLNFFVLRNGYNYNKEELDLVLESSNSNESKQIISLQSLKSQGVINGSILKIVKKSKSELKHLRKSIANIKKKAAAHSVTTITTTTTNASPPSYSPQSSDDQSPVNNNNSNTSNKSSSSLNITAIGANLIVIEEFDSPNPNMLKLKKGEQINVIEEDLLGGIYWRGKSTTSGRIGLFPVTHVKYLELPEKNENENTKMKQELEIGLNTYGTTQSVPQQRMEFKFWKWLIMKKNKPLKKDTQRLSKYMGYERYSDSLPKVVEDCLTILSIKSAFKEEGLFRISGDLTVIHQIKKKLDRGKVVNLSQFNEHTIAGVLKKYLRDLEDPIFTFELYEAFLKAINIADKNGRIYAISKVLALLPPGNLAIVKKLFSFFVKQTQYVEQSKMTPSNIAIIFAPTLLRPQVDTIQTILSDDSKRFIEQLITDYDLLFPIEGTSKKGSANSKIQSIRQMPVLPGELDKLLTEASSKLESNLKLEKERNTNRMSIFTEISRNSTSPSQNITIFDIGVGNDGSYAIEQEDEIEKTLEKGGITIRDLVDCLLQDNHTALETYLESIPMLQRDKIRSEVWELFHEIMYERGISPMDETSDIPTNRVIFNMYEKDALKKKTGDDLHCMQCNRCEEKSTSYCEQCKLEFCYACSVVFHASGTKSAHKLSPIVRKLM